MTTIPMSSVASMIGVSDATVRNWVRAGYLTPTSKRPLLFNKEEAASLKTKLSSGSITRLRSRVNKIHSGAVTTPQDYSCTASAIEEIRSIAKIVKANSLSLDRVLYVVAVRLLTLRGEMTRKLDHRLDHPEAFWHFRRMVIREEVEAWRGVDPLWCDSPIFELLYSSIETDHQGDFLGLLYQSISEVGLRNNQGVYYTPAGVVDEVLRNMAFTGEVFLDPCCGTGSFLLGAERVLGLRADQLYGVDNDQLAVHIARLNVLLAYPNHDSPVSIWCEDALTDFASGKLCCETNRFLGGVDHVATNPPWGTMRNVAAGHPSSQGSTTEAFSLFLYKSLTLLREGGTLSFILPEAFLNVRAHKQIRDYILKNAKIERIANLGRRFTGVFSGAIQVDLRKGRAAKEWQVSVRNLRGETTLIPQERFAHNSERQFDIDLSPDDACILRKIYSVEHTTLEGRAEWALGIVTGNNEQFLSPIQHPGMEPIFKGSEIGRYLLKKPSSYIHYRPALFQQVARNELYRAPEKLVYRFISSRLVFAIDYRQRLTLNSANILVPSIPGLSIRAVLAFLNSSLFQFIFLKKFATNKVLRGDLEVMPFPVHAKKYSPRLEALIERSFGGEPCEQAIDQIIFDCFSLSREEIASIMRAVGVPNGTA